MPTFGMEPIGMTAVDAQIRGLGEGALSVYEIAFPAIHDDFQRLEANRFANEGPGWAPLSPTTIRIKQRRGYDQPETPMVATGNLLYSLAGTTEHSVFDLGPEEITMGTNLPYAQYHQNGPRHIRVFGRGSAILPQRKVVDIDAATRGRWAAIIQMCLMRAGRMGSHASVSTAMR